MVYDLQCGLNMNSCIDKILSIIMDNGYMILALFLYNILILIILELLGNKKCTNFNNDRINFIANFKHKRRNLYQNFKFKIDCIAYPFIMIIFILLGNDEILVLKCFLLFILLYKIVLPLINTIIKTANKFKKLFKNKINILMIIKLFAQKHCIDILVLLFAIVTITNYNTIKNNKNSIFVGILGSLFVWGLVEYMSFRYDIIRDVIKERDECYNAILLHFDNKNKVGKSLFEIIEEKGFEENFYPLTTEYIELFCKISSKDNVDKKLILDIYEKYKNEKIEFWYYNILSKWKYLFNDKIEEYNGTIYYNKELKNIYDKE